MNETNAPETRPEAPSPAPSRGCACCGTRAAGAGCGGRFFGRGGWLLLALPLWFAVYHYLNPFADFLTASVFGLDLKSHLGSAVAFFLYDSPKVLMLLALVVLGVTFVQTFVNPERTRESWRSAPGPGGTCWRPSWASSRPSAPVRPSLSSSASCGWASLLASPSPSSCRRPW